MYSQLYTTSQASFNKGKGGVGKKKKTNFHDFVCACVEYTRRDQIMYTESVVWLCLERTLLTTKEDDMKKTEVGYIIQIWVVLKLLYELYCFPACLCLE